MRLDRKKTVLVASLVPLVALAACGSSSGNSSATTAAAGATTTTAGAATSAGGGTATDLSKICPNPLVVQTDWYPEVDHWEQYAVADPASAEIKGDRVIADMIDPRTGGKTGIKVEIRNGGPATQFEQPTATMYKDPSILLGYISTDEAVQYAKDKPTVAIVAPRETSPQIIMWDPATYPDVKTIADLKAKNVKIRYFKNATYMQYLIGAGIVAKSQADDSYDGKPDAFVADGGKSAQQGFATAEPYLYQNEIKQWMKPVKYQLISQAGYDYYGESLATKPENITKYADCFKALVPIYQAANLQMAKNPKPVEDFIVKVVQQQNSGWVYDSGEADYAVKASLDNGVVGNGPDSTTGNFDDAKVAKLIGVVTPILKSQGVNVNEVLKPSDIVTNQFIDTSIGFSK